MKLKLDRFIPIVHPSEDFERFLKIPNNSRILFSGIFGSGKTTFLKEFFRVRTQYVKLHLFPVNYVIAGNEDVFELIKYDIIHQLLEQKPDLEKINVSFLDALPFVWEDYKLKELASLFKFIPKVGKPIGKVITEILSIQEKVENKVKSLSEGRGEKIRKYANIFHSHKGGIYEHDFYTELIKQLVKEIKTRDSKETVLIIDDLDRIDPEHIFRLLNIFSAHYDLNDPTENKFGFDKIIIVCDANNIRKIFHNRFGHDTDYNGYIDKFFSLDIYELDNRNEIQKEVQSILKTLKPNKKRLWNTQSNFNEQENFKSLEYILISMVESGALSLRRLATLFNKEHQESVYKLNSTRVSKNKSVYFLHVLDLLLSLFGGFEQLQKAVNRTTFVTKNESCLPRLVGNLLLLYDYKEFDFSSRSGAVNNAFKIAYEVTTGMTHSAGEMVFGEANRDSLTSLSSEQLQALFAGAIDNYRMIRQFSVKD